MRVWDTELLTVKKTDPSYITDGLYLWLDGIQNTRSGHDSTATVWEDLSGNNNDFVSKNGTPVWGADHCAFNGVFYFERSSNFGGATTEVCYKNDSSQLCVFTCNNGAGIYEYSSKLYVGRGSSLIKTYAYQKPSNLISVSFSDSQSATINGVLQSSSQSANWGESYGNLSRIGFRNDNSTAYRKPFQLYSLRFYNRILSSEEIAQNYFADQIRFGVGGV